MHRKRKHKVRHDRNHARHELHSGKQPEWMWTRMGHISLVATDVRGDGTKERTIPLFFTHEDARYAISPELWETGVRPCRIGSLDYDANGNRETLDSVLKTASFLDGCKYCGVMVGRAERDGSPIYQYLDISWERLMGGRK